jgi:hypothetical protein
LSYTEIELVVNLRPIRSSGPSKCGQLKFPLKIISDPVIPVDLSFRTASTTNVILGLIRIVACDRVHVDQGLSAWELADFVTAVQR